MKKAITTALLLLIFSSLSGCQAPTGIPDKNDWGLYKTLFLHDDGRIIDTGNDNVSHSEGQGYGMLLAVRNGDREAFERIWTWTREHLQVREDRLFIWRRRPETALADEDFNNASDGDILIAWALLEAAAQWPDIDYRLEAAEILDDLKQKLIDSWDGELILLPGEYGFKKTDETVINLSYWIFPAFAAFAEFDPDPVWPQLSESGLRLLQRARFGRWQLPPDWLQLNPDKTMTAAKNKRFGYDAIRIPLYLTMAKIHSEFLRSVGETWLYYGTYTPAWIALDDNVMDSFGASSGIVTVKNLSLWFSVQQKTFDFPRLDDKQDYYSATLLLLSQTIYRDIAATVE